MKTKLEQKIVMINAYINKTFYHNRYGETLSGQDAFENLVAVGMGRTSTKEVLFYTACGKTEEAAKESLDACIRATGFNGEISRTEVIKK